MFTGLIADVGTVSAVERGEEGARLRVETALASELAAGDSIALNGSCLTAAAVSGGEFEAEVMNQTLSKTSLAQLEPGGRVNLELAVRASDRLGGHIVQGHVDGTGVVRGLREDGVARRLEIELEPELLRMTIEQGSIAIDGVSLTVAAHTEGGLEVSLIPETLERTNLSEAAEGRPVNVELDVVARYVDRLLSPLRHD